MASRVALVMAPLLPRICSTGVGNMGLKTGGSRGEQSIQINAYSCLSVCLISLICMPPSLSFSLCVFLMSMCISECLCVYLNFRVYIFFFFQYFSIFHSLCVSLSLSLSLLFSFFLFVSLSITRWLHHVATITITSEDFFSLTFLSFLLIVPDLGSRSGGRSVGRAVTSDSRGPRFESSHQQKFILSIYCQL